MDPLAGARYLSLATFRKNGRAVETPIWFAERGGSYFAFSESKAGKVKRLRNSSRSRVAPCDMRGRLRGEWMDAETVIVHDPEVEKDAYEVLLEKYGFQLRITNLFSRLAGKIGKRAVLEIRLTASPGHPDAAQGDHDG